MKKKHLSLLTSIISLFAIMAYAVLCLLFILRVASGKEFVPQVEKSFWLYEVLQRLSKAGFNMFFSIIGIILSVILITYRSALAYFYVKVYKGDADFYKARKSEIIFFSILAGGVSFIVCWFYVNSTVIPPEFKPIMLVLFVIYILLCALPVVELVIDSVTNEISGVTTDKVPSKEDIVEELDELADETVEKAIKENLNEEDVNNISEENTKIE